MATILPPDFREFLRLLNCHGVEYLVVGGYAVSHYGYPRATVDLDVWVAVGAVNAARIRAALEEFGFDSAALTEELFLTPDQIIRMGVPPLRIELLTGVSGVTFEECYPFVAKDEIDGIPVSFIGLEHLKRNKKASGRHKDLNDLEHLP